MDMEPNIVAQPLSQENIFTDVQSQFLGHIIRFLGPISFLGSSLIIYIILAERRQLLKSSYDRIILGLSFCDALGSLAFGVFGPWAIPEEATFIVGAQAPNHVACDIAGWFTHMVNGSIMYSASLMIYFILLVRLEWRPEKIACQVEPWLHAIPIGVTLTTATTATALGYMNPYVTIPGTCWLSAFPPGCDSRGSTVDCIRGEGSREFAIGLAFFPFVSVIILSVAMLLLVRKVRTTELRISRYRINRQDSASNFERTRRTAKRGLYYIAAYAVSYIPPAVCVYVFVRRPDIDRTRAFLFSVVIVFFLPLQGLFNAIIYIYPKWSELTKQGRPLYKISQWRSLCRGGNATGQQHQGEEHVVGTTIPASTTSHENSTYTVGPRPTGGNLHQPSQLQQKTSATAATAAPTIVSKSAASSTATHSRNTVQFLSNTTSATKSSSSSSWSGLHDATVGARTISLSGEEANCHQNATTPPTEQHQENQQHAIQSPNVTGSDTHGTDASQRDPGSPFHIEVTPPSLHPVKTSPKNVTVTTMATMDATPFHISHDQEQGTPPGNSPVSKATNADLKEEELKQPTTTSSSTIVPTSATTLVVGDFGSASLVPEDIDCVTHSSNLISEKMLTEDDLHQPAAASGSFVDYASTQHKQITNRLANVLAEQLLPSDQESSDGMSMTDKVVPDYDVVSSGSEEDILFPRSAEDA